MRIVSLCPSNTEILACLGLTKQIVGVDHYSDWPNEVQYLPNLGSELQINMEKVKKLEPDLIVASLSVPGMEKVVEEVKMLPFPYLVLDPHSIQDIYETIETVGVATDRVQEAQQLIATMKSRIERIREICPKIEPPIRLYWEWWPKPVFTPGGKNWLTEVSEIVSAVNIFADNARDNVQTDWETVAELEPDYCLAVWTGIPIQNVKKERILSRDEWQGKSFNTQERIHILEEGWFCRPSPRLLTGIEHLAHLLYPEIFP